MSYHITLVLRLSVILLLLLVLGLLVILLLWMQVVVVVLHVSLTVKVGPYFLTRVVVCQGTFITAVFAIAVLRRSFAAIFLVIITFFCLRVGLVVQKVRLVHMRLGNRLLKRVSI